VPDRNDKYYIAFDKVYDNMDVVNKLLELQQLMKKYPEQIILLDVTCFEEIILSFKYLIEWTGTGKKDKIEMREHILQAIKEHKIDIAQIKDNKTLNYLMGFKYFSTERVLKSITYELTDNDMWHIKGALMGDCWYKDCCVLKQSSRSHCGVNSLSGVEKIRTLLMDRETQRIVGDIQPI